MPVKDAGITAEIRPAIARRTLAIVALSVIGIGVSAYLSYEHYSSGDYFCAGLGDCDYVNSSPYALLFGIPVALLGLLTYGGILAAALFSIWRQSNAYQALLGIFGLAVVGVLFSAYLTYVELFVLYAI